MRQDNHTNTETPQVKISILRIATIALMGLCVSASAAEDWENEQIIGINKEDARATSCPFQSVEAALTGDYAKSDLHQSLNGKSKFNCSAEPKLLPLDF